MNFSVLNARKLERGLSTVRRELQDAGIWTSRMQDVPVRLGCVGIALGYQNYYSSGEIVIPGFSVLRMLAEFKGEKPPLVDVLRHEYGHAFAYNHPRLIKTVKFREVFGAPHDSSVHAEYDPLVHISAYAATDPSEDFAEVFAYRLRFRGVLPASSAHPAVRRKWKFVGQLFRAASRYK